MQTSSERINDDIRTYGIEKLEQLDQIEYASELHHYCFNEDYFKIGRYHANKWIGIHAFSVIEVIQKYEQDNFGEVTTDLGDPEKVANMIAYVVGEEILNECKTLQAKWDGSLNKEDLEQIIKEIKGNK